MNKLLILCISALVATCVATTCGGATCGNAGDLCCGNRCYSNVTHSCINGVLCGKGYGVCKGNVCYDPTVATCFPGSNSTNDVLCGKGLYACGSGSSKIIQINSFLTFFKDAICYDSNNYYCLNLVTGPVILQNSQANLYCGAYRYAYPYACCIGRVTEFVFDPSLSSCVFDNQGSGKAAVCPFTSSGQPQKGCQADYISIPFCYDSSVDKCCHSVSVHILTRFNENVESWKLGWCWNCCTYWSNLSYILNKTSIVNTVNKLFQKHNFEISKKLNVGLIGLFHIIIISISWFFRFKLIFRLILRIVILGCFQILWILKIFWRTYYKFIKIDFRSLTMFMFAYTRSTFWSIAFDACTDARKTCWRSTITVANTFFTLYD